jgi:hypothetical protein
VTVQGDQGQFALLAVNTFENGLEVHDGVIRFAAEDALGTGPITLGSESGFLAACLLLQNSGTYSHL